MTHVANLSFDELVTEIHLACTARPYHTSPEEALSSATSDSVEIVRHEGLKVFELLLAQQGCGHYDCHLPRCSAYIRIGFTEGSAEMAVDTTCSGISTIRSIPKEFLIGTLAKLNPVLV